jgi:hypothetical protein
MQVPNAEGEEPGGIQAEATIAPPSRRLPARPVTATSSRSSSEPPRQAAKFIGSLDNVLGEIVEGRLAAVNGCWQCHGSTVTVLKNPDGTVRREASGAPLLDPSTWPNTGIGRVNLDGTLGTCTACHSRHVFSKAMARQPEVCGKCHLGPDHPQAEIYDESKHGIAHRTQMER